MKCISCTPCTISKVVMVLALGRLGYSAACSVSTGPRSTASADAATTTEIKRGTAIGNIAPDFDLAKFDGGNISLKQLEGKPAVLVFWTAWCPICKEEAPHINKLAAEFEAKGVKVVGINIGESDARISGGIKDFGIRYTVAADKDTSVAKSYNVVGTPTVVILDKKGAVQYFGNELPRDYSDRLNRIIEG